jgi:hypothetical protein
MMTPAVVITAAWVSFSSSYVEHLGNPSITLAVKLHHILAAGRRNLEGIFSQLPKSGSFSSSLDGFVFKTRQFVFAQVGTSWICCRG